jgi:hypothetical protein
MRKYLLNYQILSDFQVVVEAEDEDEARDMLLEEGLPTQAVGDVEVEFLMSDVFYDTIDISELTE